MLASIVWAIMFTSFIVVLGAMFCLINWLFDRYPRDRNTAFNEDQIIKK